MGVFFIRVSLPLTRDPQKAAAIAEQNTWLCRSVLQPGGILRSLLTQKVTATFLYCTILANPRNPWLRLRSVTSDLSTQKKTLEFSSPRVHGAAVGDAPQPENFHAYKACLQSLNQQPFALFDSSSSMESAAEHPFPPFGSSVGHNLLSMAIRVLLRVTTSSSAWNLEWQSNLIQIPDSRASRL